MDEVLRLDLDKALVIIRGKNILEVNKYDYSRHPESKKLRPSKASAHVPEWRKSEQPVQTAEQPKPARKKKLKAAPQPQTQTETTQSEAKELPKAATEPIEQAAPPESGAQKKDKTPLKPSQVSGGTPAKETIPPRATPLGNRRKVVTATKESILAKPKKEE